MASSRSSWRPEALIAAATPAKEVPPDTIRNRAIEDSIMMVATAAGGALLVWSMVSRTKHLSEGMLETYRELLAKSRAERARKVERQRSAGDELNDGEPPEVK